MRLIFVLPLPLLALAACDVDRDAGNDQVRIGYNEQKIEDAAAAAGRTVEEVGQSVGNVAADTGRAIKNEVGDIDVDVDVKRDRGETAESNTAAAR